MYKKFGKSKNLYILLYIGTYNNNKKGGEITLHPYFIMT